MRGERKSLAVLNLIFFDKQKPISGRNYNTNETLIREDNNLGGKQNILGIGPCPKK